MAKSDNLTDFLTDLADTIRLKKGTTDKINPQNFSDEIISIQSGESILPLSVVVGTWVYTDDDAHVTVIFNKDNTFSRTTENSAVGTEEGTYMIVNDTVITSTPWFDGSMALQVTYNYSCIDGQDILVPDDTNKIHIKQQPKTDLYLSVIIGTWAYIDAGGGVIQLVCNDDYSCNYSYIFNNELEFSYDGTFNIKENVITMTSVDESGVEQTATFTYAYADGQDTLIDEHYTYIKQKIENDVPLSIIAGEWRYEADGMINSMVFNKDYTFTNSALSNGETIYGYDGTFAIYRNTIITIATDGGAAYTFTYDYADDQGVLTDNQWTFTKQEVTNKFVQIIERTVTELNAEDFEGVTIIGRQALTRCPNLTSVVIGDSVQTIGADAFSNCTELTSVVIGNSVETIGNNAFYHCTSLSNIIIPEGVTYIGNFIFYSCSGLTSIVIPSSVTQIGNNAFQGCSNLAEITIKATVPPTLNNTAAIPSSYVTTIYIPTGTLEAYQTATNWSSFADKFVEDIEVKTDDEVGEVTPL